MERLFARSLETLPAVMEAVSTFCSERGAAGGSVFALSFAVEEVFTNMVKYNGGGPAEVSISLTSEGNDLIVRLEDEEDVEFDPTTIPSPDFDAALSERKPGGLGLYLIRKMVKHVDYRREAKKSIITLTHPME